MCIIFTFNLLKNSHFSQLSKKKKLFYFIHFFFSQHRTLVEEHRQKNGIPLTDLEKREIKELDSTLPVVREQQQEQRERQREREESDARARRSSNTNNNVSYLETRIEIKTN